jgi:hypothetical protein
MTSATDPDSDSDSDTAIAPAVAINLAADTDPDPDPKHQPPGDGMLYASQTVDGRVTVLGGIALKKEIAALPVLEVGQPGSREVGLRPFSPPFSHTPLTHSSRAPPPLSPTPHLDSLPRRNRCHD